MSAKQRSQTKDLKGILAIDIVGPSQRIPSAGVTCMMNRRLRRQPGKKTRELYYEKQDLDILDGLTGVNAV